MGVSNHKQPPFNRISTPLGSTRISRRFCTPTDEIAGGTDVFPRTNEILIRPSEGARLPVLETTHKVTAEASGGSLKIEERTLPPGEMIPPHTHDREDECS